MAGPAKKLAGLLRINDWSDRRWASQITRAVHAVENEWYDPDTDPWVGRRPESWPAWRTGGLSFKATFWAAAGPRLDDRKWLRDRCGALVLSAVEDLMPEPLRGTYTHTELTKAVESAREDYWESSPSEETIDRISACGFWLKEASEGLPEAEAIRLAAAFRNYDVENGPWFNRRRGADLARRFMQEEQLRAEIPRGPALPAPAGERVMFRYSGSNFMSHVTEVYKRELGREAAAGWLLAAFTPREQGARGAQEVENAGV